MIGERINPTGRKCSRPKWRRAITAGVVADALAQVEAGAQMLDVNAGIPLADEPRILAECIKLVQETVDVPLSIDCSIVEALEAGLAVYKGKPLVNSVTGEEERLERVLPLIKKYGAAVIAISNDETGISEDPDVRFAVAKKIVERAADFGIQARGHRRRSAGDAGRRDQRRRRASHVSPAPAAGRAQGQHQLRRVQLLLRPAEPARPRRCFPADDDRRGPDLGDHESAARRRHRRRSSAPMS